MACIAQNCESFMNNLDADCINRITFLVGYWIECSQVQKYCGQRPVCALEPRCNQLSFGAKADLKTVYTHLTRILHVLSRLTSAQFTAHASGVPQ